MNKTETQGKKDIPVIYGISEHVKMTFGTLPGFQNMVQPFQNQAALQRTNKDW